MSDTVEFATFGAGCFWCVEAVFDRLNGVISVKPGYAGGDIKNPSYREVCTGRTGHAEVVRIAYDPEHITYGELLEVFFATHDPTTLNRQGADVGTQYRSSIFFHDETQRKMAELAVKTADESGDWQSPIVTTIEPMDAFYEAEDYHHDYFKYNSDQPYCAAVIRPKLEKFKARFAEKLKAPDA
jgi:peptide-methionine (S)-S-oxide reductase